MSAAYLFFGLKLQIVGVVLGVWGPKKKLSKVSHTLGSLAPVEDNPLYAIFKIQEIEHFRGDKRSVQCHKPFNFVELIRLVNAFNASVWLHFLLDWFENEPSVELHHAAFVTLLDKRNCFLSKETSKPLFAQHSLSSYFLLKVMFL